MFITDVDSSQLHAAPEHWPLLVQLKFRRGQAAASESITVLKSLCSPRFFQLPVATEDTELKDLRSNNFLPLLWDLCTAALYHFSTLVKGNWGDNFLLLKIKSGLLPLSLWTRLVNYRCTKGISIGPLF